MAVAGGHMTTGHGCSRVSTYFFLSKAHHLTPCRRTRRMPPMTSTTRGCRYEVRGGRGVEK